MTGIEATRTILDAPAGDAVLILTMSEDDDSLFAAMRAGARGYLPKDSDSEELVRAIRAAALGDVIFGQSIATRLMAFFADPRTPTAAPFPELTDREDEVLELIARGRANGDIAARLGISDKTVRNHVANIFNKLHVADRAQAIIRAREAGLGRDDDQPLTPAGAAAGPARALAVAAAARSWSALPGRLPGRPGHAPDVPGTSGRDTCPRPPSERPFEGQIRCTSSMSPPSPAPHRPVSRPLPPSQRPGRRLLPPPISTPRRRLVRRRGAGLQRYVRSLVRDPDEAADVCQEAFVRLRRRGPRRPRARRARARGSAASPTTSSSARPAGAGPASACSTGWPSATTRRLPRIRSFAASATSASWPRSRLASDDDRTAMLLAAQGYRAREIGQRLGRTELATRALICRARGRLREAILAGEPA